MEQAVGKFAEKRLQLEKRKETQMLKNYGFKVVDRESGLVLGKDDMLVEYNEREGRFRPIDGISKPVSVNTMERAFKGIPDDVVIL